MERNIIMQTEHLKVTGMTCSGCTSTVTQALKAVTGVDDVNVSLPAGEATVQYDERQTSPEQLKSAVKGAGYYCAETSSQGRLLRLIRIGNNKERKGATPRSLSAPRPSCQKCNLRVSFPSVAIY
jgi:copper chaperone